MNKLPIGERPPSLPWIWLALGLTGVCARIWLWWFSIGSEDAVIRNIHGLHVATEGLAQTYRDFRVFNHPPLMGLYASQAWQWAAGDLWTFARLIKLPGLFGEALTMAALWRWGGPRTFAVYACLPAAILVSSYHGSTDSLCAALVLVAAIAFDGEHYFMSGLLWSAALNIKVIPVVLVPLAFLTVPNRRALLRLGAGFALGLTPFVPPALAAGSAMYRNMILYNSQIENWGITFLLAPGLASPAFVRYIRPIWEWWILVGRYAILLSITTAALVGRFHRRMPMNELTALGAALFLILAPGFGVQYVIYAAPLFCLVDLKQGLLWGWISGVFIGADYLTSMDFWIPLRSPYRGLFPFGVSVLGFLAWAILIHFVWRQLCSRPTLRAPANPRMN